MRRLPCIDVQGDRIRLDGIERRAALHDHILRWLARALHDDPVWSLYRLPGIRHPYAAMRPPDPQFLIGFHLRAADQRGNDAVGKAETRRCLLIYPADPADGRGAGHRHGFLARQQPHHRHGVAAHVHDPATRCRIRKADIGIVGTHVIAEIALDQPYLTDDTTTHQFQQLRRLRRAAIHERLHQEDIVPAHRLDHGHRLTIVRGERLLTEHVLSCRGAGDGPFRVEMVG